MAMLATRLAVAIGLAVVGQSQLMRGVRVADGWLLYGLAFVILWPGLARGAADRTEPLRRRPLTRTMTLAGLLSLALAGSAAVQLSRADRFNDGLALYALAGLTLLAASQHVALPRPGLVLQAVRLRLAGQGRDIGLAAGLLALGVAFRLYGLGYYPPYPGAASDEGNMALFATRMLADPAYRPIYDPMGGSVNMYHPIALAFAIFGANTFSLRLPSIVAGILTLFPFYGLARELLSRRVALACLGFFALSFWHNNVARFAFDWAHMILFAVTAIYLLTRGLRTASIATVVLAGIVMGMGVYSYIAFRFLPIIVGAYLLVRCVFQRGFLRSYALHLLAASVAFLAVAGPNLATAQRAGSWMGQTFVHVVGPTLRTLSLNDAVSMGQRFMGAALKVVGRMTGDWLPLATRERALLDPIVAALVVLGVAYCLAFFWRRHNLLLAMIVLGVPFASSALSLTVTPYSYRYFAILPFVYLAAGALLDRLTMHAKGPLASRAAGVALALLVAASGVWNTAVYAQHSSDCRARVLFHDRPWDVFARIAALPPGYDVYIVSSFPWHFRLETYTWMATGVQVHEVRDLFAAVPAPQVGSAGVVYVVTDPVDSVVSRYLQSVYPGSAVEERSGPVCTAYRFSVVTVSREQAEAALRDAAATTHGLRGRYYSGAGWQGEPAYARVDPPYRFRFDDDRRMSVVWDGALEVPVSGVYTFTVATAKESFLSIDGALIVRNAGLGDHVVPASGVVDLLAGTRRINLRYDRFYDQGEMTLSWTPPGGRSEIIPIEILTPGTTP